MFVRSSCLFGYGENKWKIEIKKTKTFFKWLLRKVWGDCPLQHPTPPLEGASAAGLQITGG